MNIISLLQKNLSVVRSQIYTTSSEISKTILRCINTFAIIFRVKSILTAWNGANFLGSKTSREAAGDLLRNRYGFNVWRFNWFKIDKRNKTNFRYSIFFNFSSKSLSEVGMTSQYWMVLTKYKKMKIFNFRSLIVKLLSLKPCWYSRCSVTG